MKSPTEQTSSAFDPAARARAEAAPPERRPALLLAVAAGICWAGAVGLLISSDFAVPEPLAPLRLIYYVLVLAAGLLTFVPTQRHLQIPGLAFQGVLGSFLLLYVLAFVPPPTGWLLSLPDTPVYLLFTAALFWTTSAIALPLVYTLGRRIFHQRARQYDLRRARRQAHEIGALVASCALLAGLRAFTPLAVLLVALILIVAEMLFLSYIEPGS